MNIIITILLMLFFGSLKVDKKQSGQIEPEPQLPSAEYPAEFATGQIGYNKWFDKNTTAVFEEMSETGWGVAPSSGFVL